MKPYRPLTKQPLRNTHGKPFGVISNNRGSTLLVTLAVITLIIAVTLEINRQVRSALTRTDTHTNRLQATQLAASGIQTAMAMLVKDRNESQIDSLLEDWADPDKIEAVLADLSFENASVSVNITDELSRIQVNALVAYTDRRSFNESQRVLWEQLIQNAMTANEEFEALNPDEIINAAKYWLDAGDDDAITGLSGAESDYYQGLDSPYACENGPFTHLAELGLLKGFSPKLLYGSDTAAGLEAYLTVRGAVDLGGTFEYQGRINLNTADPLVLAAILPWENKELVPAIVDYRQLLLETGNRAAFENPQWYRQAPGCSDIEIDPALVTVASDLLRIEATAGKDETRLSVVALVRREKQKTTGRWMCKTLQLETK